MKIKSSDLVLEVGSGDKPYPRSDVLLDRLPEDSSEREAGRGLVIDRPMVVGDVEALPFADKSFDYIIASHVLEHADNSAKFLDEISRVGRWGYIETPLPLRERVFDWPFHRWYVYQTKGKLVLAKKTIKSKKFFAGMSAGRRKDLYHLEGKKILNLKFEWQGKIRYKIFKNEPRDFLERLDKELVELLGSKETEPKYWLQRVKSRLLIIPGMALVSQWLKTNLFRIKFGWQKKLQVQKRRKDVDIFSLIVCPDCRGELVLRRKRLACQACGRQFSFYQERVPVLLPK